MEKMFLQPKEIIDFDVGTSALDNGEVYKHRTIEEVAVYTFFFS